MILAFFALLGAVAGSFANVVIHRVPVGGSVLRPRSSCPHCGRPIRGAENIPVLSYVALAGRCRGCKERIGLQYPLVEAGTAALWAFTAAKLGFRPELPAFLVFMTSLVILAAIDLKVRRLPNRVLGPAAAVGMILLAGAAVASQELQALGRAGSGALAYGLPMLALAAAVPAGMGMGDVKFAAYLGLHLGFLGLGHVAVGAFGGFFLGACGGILLMLVGRKGRKDAIPFGPAMATGAAIALFWGRPIVRAWLG